MTKPNVVLAALQASLDREFDTATLIKSVMEPKPRPRPMSNEQRLNKALNRKDRDE